MGHFPPSFGFSYILLAIDYVSKWVEAIATRTNDARVVMSFVSSNIFCRFGLQLQELEEIWLAACDNLKFYKEKTKKFHDQKLVARKDFEVG